MNAEKYNINPILLAGSIVFEPLKVLLFFVIIGLLGFKYEGSEQSSIYIIIMVLFFAYSLCIYIINLKLLKLNFEYLILFFILFCLLISGLYGIFSGSYSTYASQYFFLFWLFSSCSILWGAEIGRQFVKYSSVINKWMELAVLIIAINSVVSVSLPLVLNRVIDYGSVTYQTMSYNSAFSFGIFLYFLLFKTNTTNRFKFFLSPFYYWFSLLLLVLLVISVIASGGRGAFILLLSYIVTNFLLLQKIRKKKSLIKKLLRIALFFIIFLFLLISISLIMKNSAILRGGFARAIQYIDISNGSISINLEEGSSNRDIVYLIAWQNFLARPILGYGFFNYIDLNGYPHNILLEFLLQGGVLYFLCMSSILVYAIIRIYKLIGMNKDYGLILLIWQYSLVMLLFSGTYTDTPLFWYGLMIILFSRKNKKLYSVEKIIRPLSLANSIYNFND